MGVMIVMRSEIGLAVGFEMDLGWEKVYLLAVKYTRYAGCVDGQILDV